MTEHRSYLVFNQISPRSRILVSVLLVGVGFLLQLTTRNILAGLPFIIACLILNFLRGISVKRVSAKKLTWQEVTPAKIDQVLQQCKRIKKFRSKDAGCLIGVVILFIFGFSFGLPLISLLVRLNLAFLATIVNAIILFGGLAFSGRKSAWMPSALDIKAEIVKRMLESTFIKKYPQAQAIPYLEVGESKEGSFPNDARLMIGFKDAPKDFIGLQGQISINSVKGRPYPYFYVVLIAKHSFDILKKFGKQSFDKLVVERKKTSEVDVIVIRQRTTKTSGYHTNTGVQDYTLETGLKVVENLLKKS
ncbi:MAG: hypothetical protein WBB37_03740 [bacterium]